MVRSQVWGRTTAALIPRSNSRRKGGQMFTKRFGLEIEFTGITRQKAAEVAEHYLGGTLNTTGDYYDTHKITAPDGRVWKEGAKNHLS